MVARSLQVLMISGDFPPRVSGVGDYAFHVSRAFAAIGIRVTVLTSASKIETNSFTDNDCIDVIRGITGWRLGAFPLVLRALDHLGLDTVVNIQYNCLAYGRSPLVTLLPALLRITRPRARTVVTMHGFWEQSQLFKLRTVPMLRAAHGLLYVDRQNETLLRYYGGQSTDRLKYIPIAGNIPPLGCTREERSSWRAALGFSERDVVIVFFGGVSPGKGLEYLLKAIYSLRASSGFAIKLLLIGGFAVDGINESYHSTLRAFMATLDAAPWTRLCDFPPPNEVSRALHSADLAVFPFLRGVGENSGSMLAALAHGLPTIVTSGQANAERMEERFGVMRVPAADVEALARAIALLISDPSLGETMRQIGLAYVRAHDWPDIAKATQRFMEPLF